MEKEQQQQDSLATVAVKDYAPSESAFSCEPPPAYQKPMRSSAVQVARIAAVTLVLMSFILGSFILAAAWVQTSRSCELQLQLQEDFSRQQDDQPSYQALVSDPLQPEESAAHKKLAAVDQRLDAEEQQQQEEAKDKEQEQEQQEQDDSADDDDGPGREQQLHFKLPLTLDFDDLAGSLVERNLRARMDCVVEKRRLDQTVAQPARELRLPFGLNVSTAPRLEHSTGERLAISCETGRDQRHMPAMEMMGPMVVPLPGPVQLPLQFHGVPPQPQHRLRPQPRPQPQPQPEEQGLPLHILEALRVPIQVAEMQQGGAEVQRIPIQITEVHELPSGGAEPRQGPGRLPPQVVAEMRAAVQLAAAEAAAAAASRRHQQRPTPMQEAQIRADMEAQARRMGPGPHLQLQLAEAHQLPLQMIEAQQIPVQMAEGQVFEAHHVPMQMAGEAEARSGQELPPLEAMQTPYQRLVPPPPQPQPPQGPARPHYVHPRSVRSVDQVLHKRDKRMRRCACDCAC